jgi:WD40 repeat protein
MENNKEHPARSRAVIAGVAIGIALCLVVALWPVRRKSADDSDIITVACSKDGGTLLGGAREGEYFLWNAGTGQELLSGHVRRSSTEESPAPFNSLALSPDGKFVVYAGATVSVSTASSDQLAPVISRPGYAFGGAAVSPDGLRISAISSGERLLVWELDGPGSPVDLGKADAGVYGATAFSPDGKRIASAGHTLRMVDVESGTELWSTPRDNYVFLCAAFRPDGKVLATGSQDTSIRLWNAENGDELAILRGHQGYVEAVSFSPDGKRIASWARNDLFVWDLEASEPRPIVMGKTKGGAAFSPDGRWIASGGPRKTVELRDANTGKIVRVMSAEPQLGLPNDGGNGKQP